MGLLRLSYVHLTSDGLKSVRMACEKMMNCVAISRSVFVDRALAGRSTNSRGMPNALIAFATECEEERRKSDTDQSIPRRHVGCPTGTDPHRKLCHTVTMSMRLCVLGTSTVEPLTSMIFLRLKSLITRVTVSRVVPIICAISSCVSRTFMRVPFGVSSPLLHQSSISLASRSEVVWDRPNVRTSRSAERTDLLSCCATRRQTSGCILMRRRNSSRRMKLTWQGSTVSADCSYILSRIVDPRPRISPAPAIRTMSVFPSEDEVVSFALPLQRMKTPRGF